MNDMCFVKVHDKWVEGVLMDIQQRSRIIEPSLMIGGHPGGTMTYPIAIVKVHGGLKEVKITDVRFQDSE